MPMSISEKLTETKPFSWAAILATIFTAVTLIVVTTLWVADIRARAISNQDTILAMERQFAANNAALVAHLSTLEAQIRAIEAGIADRYNSVRGDYDGYLADIARIASTTDALDNRLERIEDRMERMFLDNRQSSDERRNFTGEVNEPE